MVKLESLYSPARLGAVFLVAVGLLALSGCGASTDAIAEDKDRQPEVSGRQASKPLVLVRLGEFRRGEISSSLPVSAELEAVQEADVYAEVSGKILEVLHREGDFVRRGEPVVIIDDEDYRLTEENKKILRDQTKTKLEQARLAPKEGEAELQQKSLLFEKAEAEYGRALKSHKDGILSPEETETKRYEREQARIDRTTASLQIENYKLAEKEAEQALRLAEVELRTATLNLGRTQILSPIDGYISYLEVKQGEFVRANSGAVNVPAPVFSVVNLERLEARVYVPQRELRRLQLEQPVRITCDVYPEKEFWAEVEVINPVIDNEIRTVQVIVGVGDPSRLLKPGLFINAEIILDTHKNTWLVSKRAVIYENQEPVLFLVHDSVARRYIVRKGYSSQDEIEVLGLTDADGNEVDPSAGRLVLVGHNKLKDESAVEVE